MLNWCQAQKLRLMMVFQALLGVSSKRTNKEWREPWINWTGGLQSEKEDKLSFSQNRPK